MNRFTGFFKERKLAFLISLAYVGLGTLSVCSVEPSDTFYGDWSTFGVFITFPVSIASFGYRFVYPDDLILVFIIQAICFIIMFLSLGSKLKNRKNGQIRS